MRGWSFPIGRVLGVELRIHAIFVLLIGFSMSYAIYSTENGARGLILWTILFVSVAVREAARALAAACWGLDLRGLLFLPTGALASYSSLETTGHAPDEASLNRLAFVGAAASLLFGGILAAIVTAVSPEIGLRTLPWISAAHLMKSFVWANILLGLINLLPAISLDGGRLLRDAFGKGVDGTRRLAGTGQVIAVAMVLIAVMAESPYFVVMGFCIMFAAHMENQGLLLQTHVDAVTMRDVMLTDFSTLSASDTLEDALERAIHTLQDVFPVVRGSTIVGAVSRQSIVEALASGGNSYVQGVMARTFEVARPEDALVQTLRRITGAGGTQFVPILEGERVVGIVTPHHLSQSIRLRSQLPRRGRRRDD